MSEVNGQDTEKVEKQAALVVDLDSLDSSTTQEEVAIDSNADPFQSPPPPPDGVHRFKLKLGKEWKQDVTSKNKITYLSNQLTAQCVAEGESYNNMCAFDFVNTLVFDGKSRMAAIIKFAGGTVPERITFTDLAKLYRDTLAGEPIVKIRGRWKAQEKNPSPSGPNDKYVTVQAGMRNFPPLKDADGKAIPGKYSHIVEGKLTKEPVAAKFDIQEYLFDA